MLGRGKWESDAYTVTRSTTHLAELLVEIRGARLRGNLRFVVPHVEVLVDEEGLRVLDQLHRDVERNGDYTTRERSLLKIWITNSERVGQKTEYFHK